MVINEFMAIILSKQIGLHRVYRANSWAQYTLRIGINTDTHLVYKVHLPIHRYILLALD